MPILYWLTRDEDIRAASRVPYRLLEEAPDLSAGDSDFGNMLIQGDNLDAVMPLVPVYPGGCSRFFTSASWHRLWHGQSATLRRI